MKNTYNGLDKSELRSLVIERIYGLSQERLQQLLRYLDETQTADKRKYNRKDFVRIVDYTVDDRYYRDFIKDLSEGGLYIETSNKFSLGQEILMIFVSPDYQKPFKISGEITHAEPDGIGVKFNIESQVQEAVLKRYVNMIQN